jgi:hypothetical protein
MAALLMGPDGAFITGSDFLMDGGVTASYWFGELAQSDPFKCTGACCTRKRLAVVRPLHSALAAIVARP